MTRRRDATAPGGTNSEGGNSNHLGGQPNVKTTAFPSPPVLSETGQALLNRMTSADLQQRMAAPPPQRPARVGQVTVTGRLKLRIPANATPFELRRLFSELAGLPDGVEVIVKIPAHHRVWLSDALGGLDDLPTMTLVVECSTLDHRRVKDAVNELRTAAEHCTAQLRKAAS